MNGMFKNCSGLTELDLSEWDISSLTHISEMFKGCSNLQTLKLDNWRMEKVTNADDFLMGCNNLVNLSLYNARLPKRDITLYSNKLNYGSIYGILMALPELESGDTQRTLYITAANRELLMYNEISIATEKGWIVSVL